MKIADILGTRSEIINDKELMEGLERSKRDVEEGRVYELKNVDDFDETQNCLRCWFRVCWLTVS